MLLMHYRNPPHLFVADDLIWVFTPLTVAGVHSPSWNDVAWGVEMVGEYDIETFGDAVRDNTVSALAALHRARSQLNSTPPVQSQFDRRKRNLYTR